MEKYISEFLGDPDAPFANNTRLSYGPAIRQYLEWVKNNGMDCSSPESISKWFDYLVIMGAKLSTQQAKRAALRSFFGFLMEEGYISSNPALVVKLKTVVFEKKPIMTDMEIIQLCEASLDSLRDRTMLQVMLDSGLRVTEICTLNILDVSIEPPSLKIAPSKNRIARQMPLTFESAALIKKYLDTRIDSDPALFITRLGKRFTR